MIAPSRVRVEGHFCVRCDRLIRHIFGSFITYAFKWWRASRPFPRGSFYMLCWDWGVPRVDAGFGLTRLCRLDGSGDGSGAGRADWCGGDRRERNGDGHFHGAGIGRRLYDHGVHGDVEPCRRYR